MKGEEANPTGKTYRKRIQGFVGGCSLEMHNEEMHSTTHWGHFLLKWPGAQGSGKAPLLWNTLTVSSKVSKVWVRVRVIISIKVPLGCCHTRKIIHWYFKNTFCAINLQMFSSVFPVQRTTYQHSIFVRKLALALSKLKLTWQLLPTTPTNLFLFTLILFRRQTLVMKVEVTEIPPTIHSLPYKC